MLRVRIKCKIMVYSVTYKSEPGYSSIENKSFNGEQTNKDYQIVNIYQRNIVQSDKKMTLGTFLSRCLCCKGNSDDDFDSPVDSPSSALVRPIGRSYNVNDEASKSNTAAPSIPSLIVTRPLDDEFSTSSTTLLLTSERNASAINLGTENYEVKKVITTPYESSQDSDTNSHCSTVKSGEKISFIREVLSCRDTFLKSLEWCDNSLTRGKKCRFVKPDEWLELKNDGTEIRLDYT